MEIKINPNNTNDMYYVICKILGQDNTDESTDIIKKAFEKGNKDNFVFDIELKINGIDFDFVRFVTELIKEENQCIENAVRKELKNNFEGYSSKGRKYNRKFRLYKYKFRKKILRKLLTNNIKYGIIYLKLRKGEFI